MFLSQMLQLNLPRGSMADCDFIALKSHGGLSAPTEQTLGYVLSCDHLFNILHGEGAQVKDGRNILERTSNFILQGNPEIPEKIAKLFVKIKYHARQGSIICQNLFKVVF